MSTHTRIHLRCLSLVLAGALAAPAAAAADSIVYVKHGNVYAAKPSGRHAVRLTSGGHWHSPAQSSTGLVAAVRGTGPIVVMRRDGKRLHAITTRPAPSADGGTFAPRPVNLAFSPDGAKLAYEYTAFSCPVASTCGSQEHSVFYTRTNVRRATPIRVYGEQWNVGNPSFVTNTRALVFGGFGRQVSIDDLGGGNGSNRPWITPNDDQGDGELSPNGRRLATTFFYGEKTTIAFFAVRGNARRGGVPAQPDVACSLNAPDSRYADPTWSPSSKSIAFQSHRGIEVMRFTAFGANRCATAGGSKPVVRGGSEPDWGPANPPAHRYRSR